MMNKMILIPITFIFMGASNLGFAEIPYIKEFWIDFHNRRFDNCQARLDLAHFALFYDKENRQELIYVCLLKSLVYEQMNYLYDSNKWKEIAVELSN